MKVDAVPHGFRSTFRDWCSERTDYPGELAEAVLDHVIENKTEAAYRCDLFDKRRLLMADWSDFGASALRRNGVANWRLCREPAWHLSAEWTTSLPSVMVAAEPVPGIDVNRLSLSRASSSRSIFLRRIAVP